MSCSPVIKAQSLRELGPLHGEPLKCSQSFSLLRWTGWLKAAGMGYFSSPRSVKL